MGMQIWYEVSIVQYRSARHGERVPVPRLMPHTCIRDVPGPRSLNALLASYLTSLQPTVTDGETNLSGLALRGGDRHLAS